MTLTGGVLFDQPWATLYAVCALIPFTSPLQNLQTQASPGAQYIAHRTSLSALPVSVLFISALPWERQVQVTGASSGACCLFKTSQSTIGAAMRRRIRSFGGGGLLDRLRQGLLDHGAIYMMLVRLVPIFPFWFVNIGKTACDVHISFFFSTILSAFLFLFSPLYHQIEITTLLTGFCLQHRP